MSEIKVCGDSSQKIFQRLHGCIDLDSLQATGKPNIYKSSHTLIKNQDVYFDGIAYVELFGVFPSEQDAVIYQAKMFASLREQKDYVSIFQRIEKKIGLPVYLRLFDEIPMNQKYDAFIEIYQRSEYGFDVLKNSYEKIFHYAVFSEERTQRLENLYLKHQGKITIYHGENLTYPPFDHYSWTLSKKTAEFFAYRFNAKGEIWQREIEVTEAIDYLGDRNEEEIIWCDNKL